MSVIVTDSGFANEDWNGATKVLAPDTNPDALADLATADAMIIVDMPSFADGRAFTLARLLRLAGFRGRLRVRGDLMADQYTMARRAGFDEVEITQERAIRQTEDQWLRRADWRAHDYQSRLRAAV